MPFIKITGVARTKTPLHFASPEKARVDLDGRFVGGESGFPCVRTQRMPVGRIAVSKAIKDAKGKETGETEVRHVWLNLPFITPNSLRGRIHRRCADEVEDALVKAGRQLPLAAYNVLRCGSAHGAPDSLAPTRSEYEKARANLMFGLFGGGPAIFESPLRVHGLYPLVQNTLNSGLVELPDGVDRDGLMEVSSDRELTKVMFARRVDDLLQFADPQAGDVLKDFASEMDVYLGVAEMDPEARRDAMTEEDRKAERKQRRGKANENGFRGISSFTAYEVIKPSVPFVVHIEADLPEAAQVGLLLKGMARQMDHPIGGMTRHGYGQMEWDLTVEITDNGQTEVFKSPFVRLAGRHATRHTVSGELSAWTNAADEALENFDVEEFAALAGNMGTKYESAAKQVTGGDQKADEAREQGAA